MHLLKLVDPIVPVRTMAECPEDRWPPDRVESDQTEADSEFRTSENAPGEKEGNPGTSDNSLGQEHVTQGSQAEMERTESSSSVPGDQLSLTSGHLAGGDATTFASGKTECESPLWLVITCFF